MREESLQSYCTLLSFIILAVVLILFFLQHPAQKESTHKYYPETSVLKRTIALVIITQEEERKELVQ
jgi:hypothetical protein